MKQVQKFQQEMTAFFRELYVGEQKNLVFGDGDEHAAIVMIGEAPGAQEALQGKPFVGKAGKNLDEFLSLSGLDRRALYITNTVKFRPTRISDAGRVVNRPPTQEEIKLSLPWLLREIEMIKPQTIVTLGNVPLKALLGKEKSIGTCHGQWIEWKKYKVYPLYHPASVIYNPALKETYQQDVVRLGKEVRKNSD
jgi:DNA polymerase